MRSAPIVLCFFLTSHLFDRALRHLSYLCSQNSNNVVVFEPAHTRLQTVEPSTISRDNEV